MSRPPARAHATGSDDRVMVSNARGQSRVVGDPFAPSAAMADPRGGSGPPTQLNAYGHSVNIRGETSGALLSRQQQAEMKSQGSAGMLLDALQKYGPAPGARAMLDWERDAATHAIEAGVYVTWRSRKGTDCTRVGPASLCFCGHDYSCHGGVGNAGWKKNKMICSDCPCANFSFIPRRPEECGEWWLPVKQNKQSTCRGEPSRRKEFDVRTYRAKCKCGHPHTDHDPKSSLHRCRACSGCSSWVSAFLCVVCDCHSEDHETVWETAAERIAQGKPTGEDYMPFAEAPEIRKLVFDRKAGDTEARPGENASGGPAARKRVTAAGAAAAAAPQRKVIAAGAGVGSSSAAASSSASSAAARPAPARAAASRPAAASAASSSSSAAASRVARPAASSARPLGAAFAAHSLDDAEDAEEEDGQPPPPQRAPPARQASATRASPATAASVVPRAAPRAAPRPTAAAAPTRSAAAAAPSRPAAATSSTRQQRLELESQLASQAKQSSSSFKPVFD